MQSLWGYESGDNAYNKLSNAPNPPFDHYDLQDIGVNTHAQIDAHIANSVNPHGTTLTQTTLNVTNLDEETLGGGITINTGTPGPKISGGVITPVTASTILLTDGLSVGSSSTPLNQFYSSYMAAVSPTIHPWAAAQPVDFYFVKMGSYCEMNFTHAIAASTTTNLIVFTGVVPTIMRPAANQIRNFVDSVGTGLYRVGCLSISTSGDVTFGNDLTTATTAFGSGSSKLGFVPTTVTWAV